MFKRKKKEGNAVKIEKISKKKKGGFREVREKIRETLAKKNFRIGTYTAGTTAVVVALLVVVNLCVSALPTKYTSFDMTADNL